MDRLDAIALFVAAVEAGSLAGAAKRHSRSPAAVTRAVAMLERQSGEVLLLRSTRKLSLTDAGERHLAVWREVLGRLGDLESENSEGLLHGALVLTASELFGRFYVFPLLQTFLHQHPLVSARALLVNRIVDLIGEGVDLAIRLAPLPDSTLTALRLGDVRSLLCASPEYLARAGTPETPHDLEQHECIGLNAEDRGELWTFSTRSGPVAGTRSIRVETRLSINNQAAGIEAALGGYGLVCARSYQVAEHIAAGRLVRLMPHYEPPPSPAHFVFHPDRGRRGVLRAFIEHATPPLRREFDRITAMVPPPERLAP